MKRYFGIDPGDRGALAEIEVNHDGRLMAYITDYNPSKIMDVFNGVPSSDVVVAALEEVHSMPKQGVVSTFNFGRNYGWYQGVLDGYGVPYRLVRPQVWQSKLGVKKTSDKKERKELIYETARRLFPDAQLTGSRGAILDGRSDALMIAYWLYLEEGGK
jgi:hypothetical protein